MKLYISLLLANTSKYITNFEYYGSGKILWHKKNHLFLALLPVEMYSQNFRLLLSRLVHGLVDQRISKIKLDMVPVLCSPSTGQTLVLPKVKTSRAKVKCLLGYDPLDKQFKHQVLTLGSGNMSWRMLQCSIPHFYPRDEICVNAVLGFMVNCNGKLGFSMSENHEGNVGFISGKSSRFKLWVLEDVEKQECSERVYVLPAEWKNIVGEHVLKFVGLSRTNEIVLSSWYSVKPFYLFYFNPGRNTVVRVEIEGVDMDGSKFAVL
ncbi:BnaC01g22770D [Brassica napus]|uniref:F-box associated beta-propeller type 3 domain-containing protein n=2 Tax=Brassica TaxID=3705 RepID=A0A3P6EYC4_BRAOL|nr:unnamed protein product [Brassica napus]CDY42789.1 BnaC01g22770D [Brassica napus]VDD50373.1 unnamed protein product [Brassica oleracea]